MAQATAGEDVPQIDTEQLSFQTISGDDKLRLLPSPWPADNQPSASASLLSIASGKGLVAAAGPDALVVAKTETVRSAFRNARASQDDISSESVVREYQPEAKLSIPRVSQVTFSSDESCLVIAAEQGGGLAVYDTNAITNGDNEPAFQVATNGVSVRQLLPNPNPSADTAHLFGVVLETGQFALADLKAKSLKSSNSGNPIFHENVCCAAWSRLGKQIVAGRKDGSAVQLDQAGIVKAEIPVPPKLPELSNGAAQVPLQDIYWLDTNDFLLVHTPESAGSGDEMSDMPDPSILHLARRPNAKSTEWTFQNILDPTPGYPSGSRKGAVHYFLQRLKDWPPSLDEVLMLISTASTDVGMLSKSKAPLDTANPITDTFVITQPPDDRRAGMPLCTADSTMDSTPIGMAIDLSVTEKINKPIPKDEEIDESPVPLPAMYILNHEGMLRIWYIVYNDSVRQKQPFPDLIAAGGPRPMDKGSNNPPSSASNAPPSSGFASFGNAGQSQATPPPQQSAFGAPSTPAFGSSSALGGGPKASVWGQQGGAGAGVKSPAFGQTAFGQPSTPGGGSAFGKPAFGQTSTPSAFGQTSQIGQKPGLFGSQPAQTSPSAQQAKNPFGALGGSTPQASPFAAFGQQKKDGDRTPTTSGSLFGGGQTTTSFGGVGVKSNEQPAWIKNKGETSFGSTATVGSSFGSGNTIGGFGTPSQNGSAGTFGKPSGPVSREKTMEDDETPSKPASEAKPAQGGGLFGMPSGGFKIGSTFKGDGTAKDDGPKPKDPGAGFFGSGFGSALGEAEKKPDQPTTPIKAEPGPEDGPRLQDIPAASTTPASPPKQSNDPPTKMPSRLFGDVPPADVPGGPMPQRRAGDLPPMDVPGGSEKKDDGPPKEMPKRRAGDLPPMDVPGGDEEPAEQPKKQDEAPLAGSPPVDLGNERFSEAAGSEEELPPGPEDEDEEDWDEEEEEEGEGEEEDAEEAESDHEVTDEKGLNAFMSRLGQRSPQPPAKQEQSTTPATDRKPPMRHSFTPAGFPNPPHIFQQPAPRVQDSPRSPSPQRNVTAPVQKPAFSVPSKPATPSFFGQASQAAAATSQKQSQPQQISVPAANLAPPERPAAPPKPAEPTIGELEDQEAAQIQALLASSPEPTMVVPNFLAHQNYVGQSDKDGVGGSIERLYRDVNSMVDTLGLNAHSLQGFVRGQEDLKQADEREADDVEDLDSWTLDEGQHLGGILDQLGEELEEGKLENVQDVLANAQVQAKEAQQLRTRFADIKKRIKAQTDPEQVASQLAAPLPAETQAQQMELRQSVQQVQRLLGEVEEAMSVLRAELASVEQANCSTNGATNVPTVEAVTNTILKMTAMIEKKSGDIDVLESQIRRLPSGLASLNLNDDYEDQLVTSLTGSKLLNGSTHSQASPASRSRMLANGDAPGMHGMLGSRFRTPPSNKSVMFSPNASRLGMSTGSLNGSARKKMVDVTEQEVQAYRSKTGRRRRVMDALRDEVEKVGTRTVKLEG